MDKIKAQNETFTSQIFTNLQIVVDLSASTTCRSPTIWRLVNICDVEASLCGFILRTMLILEGVGIRVT